MNRGNCFSGLAGCLSVIVAVLVLLGPVIASAQNPDLDARVGEFFQRRCATSGCHAGPVPQMGMELSRERFYASTVGEPSTERPELKIVDPGKPGLSYLMLKVVNAPGIIGAQMPFQGDELSQEEIDLVREWIEDIDEVDEARKQDTTPSVVYPFYGWNIVNLPTTRTIDKGKFLFQISHRFNPSVRSGYDTFYGLDGPGVIFISLGYAVRDDILLTLGRSNSAKNVELRGRYAPFLQGEASAWERGWPVSVAFHGAINWVTEDPPQGESRLRSDALKYSLQMTVSREFGDRFAAAFVPGLVTNPSDDETGEDPIITLGTGARWRLNKNLALVAEWVPISSGYIRTFTFGNDVRFDSWGGGLEVRTSGHIFQIIVSNSVGLTTDQYMRGGDLDIRDGDMRLGFNILRVLTFW